MEENFIEDAPKKVFSYSPPSVENIKKASSPKSDSTDYTSYPGSTVVSFGQTNEYVKAMQEKLNEKGFKVFEGANGHYGPTTSAAVRAFCNSIDIRGASGDKMGPRGWRSLFG